MIGRLAAFALLLLGLCFTPASAQKLQPPVNPDLFTGCFQSQQYDSSTSGSTKLITGTTNQQIYVCGYVFFSAGTATVKLVYGTGGTCGTGTAPITPGWQMAAQSEVIDHVPVYNGLPPAPNSNDVCINVSAGVAVQAIVYYAQF